MLTGGCHCGAIRYQVEGDTATPIDTEHVKYVGGSRLRRIDGTWKMVMQLSPGTDQNLIHRQAQLVNQQAKSLSDIAAGVEAGKYPDADTFADALDAANKAGRPQ